MKELHFDSNVCHTHTLRLGGKSEIRFRPRAKKERKKKRVEFFLFHLVFGKCSGKSFKLGFFTCERQEELLLHLLRNGRCIFRMHKIFPRKRQKVVIISIFGLKKFHSFVRPSRNQTGDFISSSPASLFCSLECDAMPSHLSKKVKSPIIPIFYSINDFFCILIFGRDFSFVLNEF